MTLARAVGAKAEVVVTVDQLAPADRDLARLVLNDLVGNALNAGAGDVRVTIAPDGPRVSISVTDDAPPMAPGCGRLRAQARRGWRLDWASSPAR